MGRVKARLGLRTYGEAFEVVARDTENLHIFTNKHVYDVTMADSAAIASAKAVDTLTGAITVYRGTQFVDCTGDGWIGTFADAEYRRGREARDRYDESLAPPESDDITMSGCIMGNALGFKAENMGRPVPYERPAWAPAMPPPDRFGRRVRRVTGGEWWLEYPGTVDDVWNAEYARDYLIRITFGYWDHVKNHSELKNQAVNYDLTVVPYMNAKRESRRLIGDYVLTQNDVQSARVFPDRISYGGWPIDGHNPEGMFYGPEGPFECNPRAPSYTIPYRCLYSRNIDNLLFAGRCASVTHIALGTVRVQSTLSTLGQAAGTAAALCTRRSISPRALYEDHIGDLQQTLLKNDQTIPGIVNEDPADKARGADVRASSTASYVEFGKENVQRTDRHEMVTDRAILFPVTGLDRLDALYAYVGSANAVATPVTLHVRPATGPEDFAATEDLRTASAVAPPKRATWVRFELDLPIDTPYVWAWISATQGIWWHMMASAPAGSGRAYGDGSANRWTHVPGQYYAFYTEPALRIPTTYRAENIVNGRIRLDFEGEDTNMWASDPREPLPQWIDVVFDRPVALNSVRLTFDTNLGPRWHRRAFPRECVRDYDILCYDDDGEEVVVSETDNFQRHRIHRFARRTVERLRLRVNATNGAPSARVYEIRAYDEPEVE